MSENEVIKKLVRDELERAGLDLDEADETQADFAYTRRKRKLEEKLAVGVRLAFLAAGIAVVVAILRYAITGEW